MTKRHAGPITKIGYWSGIKLEIVRKCAAAYSTVLSKQIGPILHHEYVDGFAGAGVHISKATGQFVSRSPLNALAVRPPIRACHPIDLDGDKVVKLCPIIGGRLEVYTHVGDADQLLLEYAFRGRATKNTDAARVCWTRGALASTWQVV